MDGLPLWSIFLLTGACSFLSAEVGFRVASHEKERHSEATSGSMVASTLGLLAFMLAFTFGVASSRFDARRTLVVQEANAIGTAYLRTDIIEEPFRGNIRHLLREYLDTRIQSIGTTELLEKSMPRSQSLQNRIWSETMTVTKKHPNLPAYALLISAVNEVIDIQSTRVAATIFARVPASVWFCLFIVAILSMFGAGYHCGPDRKRALPAITIMILAFMVVVSIVIDLDRPWEGTIRIPQEPMLILRQSMEANNQW